MTIATATEALDVCSAATLRKALVKLRRSKDPITTIVWQYNRNTRSRSTLDNDLPEIVVPEGKVLQLCVLSGLPFLHLRSGRLLYGAYSTWGNSLTVHGGNVHVTSYRDRKVTIHFEAEAEFTTDPGGVADYGRLHAYGPTRGVRPVPTEVGFNDAGIPLAWA